MDQNAGTGPKPTLWATVLADLRGRMAAGEFADRFPTDRELMAHYGVSRHTVREAVRRLDGVHRRPRLGGHVRPISPVAGLVATIAALGSPVDAEPMPTDHRRSAAVAGLLGCPASRKLTVWRHLLIAGGAPLILSELWSPSETTADEGLVSALLGVPGADPEDAWLASSHRTTPLVPPQQICADLRLPVASAVFCVETLIESGGQEMAWHRAYVRPDRYPCVIQFAP